MKSFLYFLSILMFAGLGMMIWSSYRALRVVEENAIVLTPSPGSATAPAKKDPQVTRYVTFSYLGLTLFLAGAVGAVFAAVKVMARF